jgi:hypothetical protein
MVSMIGTVSAAKIPLATEGKAQMAIVESASATPAEQTAAAELREYLHKITGGSFNINKEQVSATSTSTTSAIYVGDTAYAKAKGVDVTKLASEEWVIHTVDGNLILAGGRPRGTMYAVYHFLEDVLGVHWWNPFEEFVPSKPTLEMGSLDLRGKPTFRYRDIYEFFVKDEGRFAARSRINRTGDTPVALKWGGSVTYGLPYSCHTLARYFAPSAEPAFKEHPEWFAMINGKRVCLTKTTEASEVQMCLTNKGLHQYMIRRLKEYIRESETLAEKQGTSKPIFYSISMNDAIGGWCECPECQKVVEKEGSQAGPLLSLVNAVADRIRKEYPDIYITTLAYYDAEKVPRTICPRDNVIIILCDTKSNLAESITSSYNTVFRQNVNAWSKISKNLMVWDYGITYGQKGAGMPVPSLENYGIDYRYLADHYVQGAFVEFEDPIIADMRDLKLWVLCKILENPYQDEDKLIQTFTQEFYGPASPMILAYLKSQQDCYRKTPSYLHWFSEPILYKYIDLKFAVNSQRLFDEAARKVAGDPVRLRRVHHARLPLDRACLILYPKFACEFAKTGQTLEKYPLDRDAIAKRIRTTYVEQQALRKPTENGNGGEEPIEKFLDRMMKLRYIKQPVPEHLKNIAAKDRFYFSADDLKLSQVSVVDDSEVETGRTVKVPVNPNKKEWFALPLEVGIYDPPQKKSYVTGVPRISADQITEAGYHWYKIAGDCQPPGTAYLYLLGDWSIQLDLSSIIDPSRPRDRFDVWAKVKFTGPDYPYGNANEENAIWLERIIIVRNAK